MLFKNKRLLPLTAAVAISCNSIALERELFSEPWQSRNSIQDSTLPSKQKLATKFTATSQTVGLNNESLQKLAVGSLLNLEVDDEYLQIKITALNEKNAETLQLTGVSLDGKASFSLVKLKHNLAGRINLGNVGYLLTSDDSEQIKIFKFVDNGGSIDAQPTTIPSINLDTSKRPNIAPSLQLINGETSSTQVDVIVAYTEKLAAEVGDVDAYLALMEKDTNDSYTASDINATVNIVHSYQTGYVSTGDMSEDNSVLLNKNTSNWLPAPNPLAPNPFGVELKSLRDEHKADVMVFLADQNASSPWAGWAGQIGTDSEHALFTMSSWGTFKNTFAHELGHLYGARHDNDSTTTPFAYGHGYCNVAKTWRTMMAISNCGDRLNVWSNPNLTYQGEAGGSHEKHDNARVHNERSQVMSALRSDMHIPPKATISQVNVTPANLTASFSGFANDNDGTIESLLWDFGDGVYHNTPYAQGENVSHNYSFPGNYQVRLTARDNEGLTHSVVQDITISAAPGSSYCAAKGQNAIYQFISSVSSNGKTISSGRRQYTDHTAAAKFNLYSGSTTGFELQQGTRSRDFGPYAAYWAIYVDLNHNNSFDDEGELLHFSTPRGDSSRDPVLANITIPDSALAGNTRMRIIQSNTLRSGENELAACGDFTFGEAEDFTVNIIKEQNPADFAMTVDNDNMQVSFTGQSDNIASVVWDFGDGRYSDSSTSNTINPVHDYVFGGTYTVTLTVTLNNGDTYTQTKIVEIVAPEDQNYCRAHGNQPAYQYTANVNLNGNSVDSGSSYYTLHKDQQLGAVHGTNNISVRQGATGSESSYNANWRIYIDLDQNGTFEDTESVWYWVGVNTSRAIERQFEIPATALPGKTRMRVIQSYNEVTSPCGESRWGEVEDYEVVIRNDNPATFTVNMQADDLTAQFQDKLNNNPDIESIHYDFGTSKLTSSSSSEQSNPSYSYPYSGEFEVLATVTMIDGIKYQSQETINVTGNEFCAAWGESNTQWTSKVRLDNFSNTSDKSAFTHYEESGFTVEKGKQAEIGLTHNSNGPYLAHWAVFVDLNQNKRFEDNELLFQTSATTFEEVIGTISIPDDITTGKSLMRIVQSYETEDGKLSSCGPVSWGEVEDYRLTITGDNSNQSDLINGIAITGISVAAKEEKTFSFYVPNGATNISVEMLAGTGDPDLYVKFNDPDTTTNWNCRPYIGGNNNEVCGSDLLTQSGGTYYVTVKGWTASDNVTLTGNYDTSDIVEPPNACTSKPAQTRGNLTNNEGICLGNTTVYVAIYLPLDANTLTITTRGGNGDASVYQRHAGWPQSNNFDHAAMTNNSSEETIVISSPDSGWNYIMVNGQGEGTELVASYE